MNSRSSRKPQRRPIIAIDGPAGAGKTTTAREVARRLGFLHIDTGAMYRAMALKVLRRGCPLNKAEEIARIASQTEVSLRLEDGQARVFLDGEDVSGQIRSPEVNRAVTPVCEVPEVRTRLMQLQRQIGRDGGIVMEGRDIGTVVFPDADLKIFLTADLPERARRRRQEQKSSGTPQAGQSGIDEVSADLERRDRRDQGRGNSPLMRAADAVLIDTTHLSFEEQVQKILQLFMGK